MTTENNINQRLAFARVSLKLTQGEAAQGTSLRRGAISKIENGRQEVPAELLMFYNKIHNVSAEWLLTGEGAMLKERKQDNDLASRPHEGFSNILLVDIKSQELYPSHLNNQNYLKGLHSFSFPHSKFKVGKFRAFEAAESSLEPTILRGSIVIGKTETDFQDGASNEGTSFVFVTKDGIQIRQIRSGAGGYKRDKDEIFFKPEFGEPSTEDRLLMSDILEMWIVEAIITFAWRGNIDMDQYYKSKIKLYEMQREIETKNRIENQDERIKEMRRVLYEYVKLMATRDYNHDNLLASKKGKIELRLKDAED